MPEHDMHAYINTYTHTQRTSCLFVMSTYTVSGLGLLEQTQEGYAEQVNVPPESRWSAGSVAQPWEISPTHSHAGTCTHTHTHTHTHTAARLNTCETTVAARRKCNKTQSGLMISRFRTIQLFRCFPFHIWGLFLFRIRSHIGSIVTYQDRHATL